jgi:hypothetical protein
VDQRLRPLLEYENRMRGMFSDASRTYEDFERATMLPQPPPGTRTEIPKERWNLHPAGYLVRVSSAGHSRIRMQVVVPHRPAVTRDKWRRVTRVAMGDYVLAIEYRDQGAGTPYSGDRGLRAHAVSRVRIDVPAARGGVLTREVDAWVFTGHPAARARGRARVATPALGFRLMHASWAPMAQFGDLGRRAEDARDARDRIESYEEWWARQERIRRGERPDEDVFDAGHIRDLIESIFGGLDDRLEQIAETHGRLAEWLAHATRVLETLPDGSTVDPTDSPYAPGRSGGQTLIGSGATW